MSRLRTLALAAFITAGLVADHAAAADNAVSAAPPGPVKASAGCGKRNPPSGAQTIATQGGKQGSLGSYIFPGPS